MHVVVLGAGVVGLTTAYYLSQNGHRVTVVDSADEVAAGASGGNGGQLSYSFTDAMASPALLSKMPRMMAGLDPAFHVRPPLNSQLISWGLSFLRQCTSERNRKNTTAILKIALCSAKLMAELRSRVPLDFSFRQAGKLVMLGGQKAWDDAEELCELKRKHGCEVSVISIQEAEKIEPALQHMTNAYYGAVYSEKDEIGDSLAFTSGLSQWLLSNRDVEFRLNTTVRKIITKNGKLLAADTDQGRLDADAMVVCMGSWSNQVLHPLGIRTKIYPMRGYSLTLPAAPNSSSVSITDPNSKIVFSRLDEQIRIAGFADFVGYSTEKDANRAQTLLATARKIAPQIANYDVESINEWGGFRPLTPDSRPLIGPSKIEGLHLNTGHGMLGWTLACATSHEVASGIKA
jgi:D-amino-acid dehydrogenase